MSHPRYSIVIPVYNRPQEVEELLESLTAQTFRDFEVILVEDGSTVTSEKIFEKYSGRLAIQYHCKLNSGPGPSRNFGFEKAKGEFFVVFDSDCIVPPGYFEAVEKFLQIVSPDAWGGPDRASESFTPVQRAMGYTMSSILTTGGIRGGKKRMGWYQPRSFNMGFSRKVWEKTGGFKFDRYAEDIELSIRIRKAGFKISLIPDAYVFHKRRTDLKKFYAQVYNFGRGRVRVGKVHPGEVKMVHWLPSLILIGVLAIPIAWLAAPTYLGFLLAGFYALYFLCIGFHSLAVNRSLLVAVLSIPAAAIQLAGYGAGFLREWLKSYI